MPNALITQIVPWEGALYLYTWHPTTEICDVKPVTHIECVIFNDKGQILIMNEYGRWSIPGGAPNKGELYEDAIRREVHEEANVFMSLLKLTGYLEIARQDKLEDTFYHLVYAGVLSKLLPREIDPEAGIIHEIKFVDSSEVTKYVKWGSTGASMFSEAISSFSLNQLE